MFRKLIESMRRCSAALCQVFDSIFGDLPMSRVKFNVNTEYAYIQNFKILQSQSTHRGGASPALRGYHFLLPPV